jgi:two-component system osmolarity sensor histidine kinase EnvZ
MQGKTQEPVSLVQLNTRLLALVFIIFEIIIVAAVLAFLMIPMVRRSTDDLAGLMSLSAQTWSELPPETRASFEDELIQTHWLALRADLPEIHNGQGHGIYLYFLEQSLIKKTGVVQHFVQEEIAGDLWLWASLPSGGESIAVGFPAKRIGTHPVLAIIATLLAGGILAIFAAIWLARRITRPLKQLELAVAEVGQGNVPELLADRWPLELASLATQVNRMACQVRELLAARTTLLAGVSHDLRTPLARMRLALALFEDDPDPVQIKRVEQGIESMDQLIGNILDLARGLEKEAFKKVSLLTLLEDVAELAASERVLLRTQSELATLDLPPLALRRIISNLVGNALRYAPDGPVELVVEQELGQVRIGVLDRGPGIPPNQLSLVFQPFHRVESSRSPTTGGSGLGLAIVKQLAEIYGWQVDLGPRAGGGIAAWVVIPVKRSNFPPLKI